MGVCDPNWGCDPNPDGNVVGPIVAPAVYWTDRYRVLQSPPQGLQGGLSFLLDTNAILRQAGRQYWHIECFGVEKQFLTSVADVEFSDARSPTEKIGAMIGAHPSSQLKIMLTWRSARGEQRTLIADIGTGFDIKIGPTSHVYGYVMIPDPPVGLVTPTALAPLLLESTATLITARGTPFVAQGGTFNGRYTQTLVVGTTGAAVLHEIPAFARRVTLYVAAATLADPPAAPASSVNLSFVFDIPVAGGIAPVGFAGPFGLAPAPIHSPTLPIPQNAKFVSLSGSTEQLATLVYELSL